LARNRRCGIVRSVLVLLVSALTLKSDWDAGGPVFRSEAKLLETPLA
jgi:hypothetical protein